MASRPWAGAPPASTSTAPLVEEVVEPRTIALDERVFEERVEFLGCSCSGRHGPESLVAARAAVHSRNVVFPFTRHGPTVLS